MKVLQLCKKPPIPTIDGETIAIDQMTYCLQRQGYNVDVLASATNKHPERLNAKRSQRKGVNYQNYRIDTDLSVGKAFLNLFSNIPYNVARFVDHEFTYILKSKLRANAYDIIILEGLTMAVYLKLIRKHAKNAKVILRAHNVETKIWERLFTSYPKWYHKLYLKHILIPRMKSFEINALKMVDGIMSISEIDAQYFKEVENSTPMHVQSVGISLDHDMTPLPKQFSLGYIGDFGWKPNIHGIDWFLDNVWMKFIADKPEVTLNLAGRNSFEFTSEVKQVNVLGEVEHSDEFIKEHSVLIVPLLAGSGIKVKILEAMSIGRTVITTSIGAEGIHSTNGKNLIIADEPDKWVEELNKLYQNPQLNIQIGQNAIEIIREHYNLDSLSDKSETFIKSLL